MNRSSVGECEKLKKRHQARIAEMEKSRSNKIARFGKYWPALREEIDKLHRAGKFKQKPFGPIGSHITVKDMKYILGVEKALGMSLTDTNQLSCGVKRRPDFDRLLCLLMSLWLLLDSNYQVYGSQIETLYPHQSHSYWLQTKLLNKHSPRDPLMHYGPAHQLMEACFLFQAV